LWATDDDPAARSATMGTMTEYEIRHVVIPRGTTRGAARRLLTEQAEYGGWELARLRMFADGTRKVWLRRKIIRMTRTDRFG